MLTELNLWLGRLAPWFWLMTSLFAMGMCYRPYRLCTLYEEARGTTPTTRITRAVTGVLTWLASGMSVVGMLSIYTWFKYPVLRSQRAKDLPMDYAALSLITLLVLLAIPPVCAYIGHRKWRYLISDEFGPLESSKPSRRGKATGAPPAKRRSR